MKPIPEDIKDALMRAEPGQVVYNTPVGAVMAVEQGWGCDNCAFWDYDCKCVSSLVCIPLRRRTSGAGMFMFIEQLVEDI